MTTTEATSTTPEPVQAAPGLDEEAPSSTRLAIIASKGSLDMAYPPLMMGVQALRKGWEVGIFFTFYGLEILRPEDERLLQLSPVRNPALPMTMPTLVAALPGMQALATTMMARTLEEHEVPPIQDLLDELVEGGAKLFPCGFTIDVFDYGDDDFIPGVQAACGSPDFLEFAKDADTTVFV
jgi:peroxiredoxin family protein